MAIDKLPEFAKDGQKNTDDLVLTDGFPVLKKPARQWFNWLFNTLTLKINEIIDADYVQKSNIIDNLTTDDATKPVSAKQAKALQDNKLDKTATAAAATKLATARTIGGVAFDGTGNINLPGVNVAGNQNTTGNAATATTAAACSGNAATATKLQTARTIGGVSFDGTANINLPGVNTTGNQNTTGNAATATTATNLITASGSAPSFSARAWVNFNGTGTVAIRGSGNVSSITDKGVGHYTVNFTSSMPDASFVCSASGIGLNDPISGLTSLGVGVKTLDSVQVSTTNSSSGRTDFQNVEIAVFR